MRKHFSTIALLLVVMASSGHGQNRPDSAIERVRCSLIAEAFRSFSSDAGDFFIRLPEHVTLRSGAELNLVLRPSTELLPVLAGIMLSANGRDLPVTLDSKGSANASDPAIRLRAAVADGILAAGWNRLSVQLNTSAATRDRGKEGYWLLRRSECFLEVACERMPLFSELVRFPRSLAEEKLLHSGPSPSESEPPPPPTVAILLPLQSRDVHLRACAILGARFGQLGYLSDTDCRLASIQDWERESAERSGVIVGRVDELAGLPVLKSFALTLAELKPGQGLVAEAILGTFPSQRRWIVATAADDAGLEKALLTLGSASALAALPPSPAIIETAPVVPAKLDGEAQPGFRQTPLRGIGVKEVRLHGYHGEQSFSGWWLPPGAELAAGSFLNLRFSHPRWLTNSSLEVLLNGESLGQVALTAEDASPREAKFPLPKGLLTRDPMVMTFRSSLEVSGVGREVGLDEEAWVTVSGESTLETATTPTKVSALNQVNQLLVGDRLLRKAAFLLPAEHSTEEAQMLLDLAVRLGKQLPSSPLLWPEAAGYSANVLPAGSRVQGRSILLLGSVAQWKEALPPATRVPIEMPPSQTNAVRMQGRKNALSSFEPSLVLMQLLPSPWSSAEALLAVGGWRGFATPALKRMITEAAAQGKLFGNLCAMDASGRAAAYDSRRASSESFAEHIHRKIPLGLTVAETNRRLAQHEVRVQKAARANNLVLYLSGGLVSLFVLVRLFFLWDRERRRKKSIRDENPVTSSP